MLPTLPYGHEHFNVWRCDDLLETLIAEYVTTVEWRFRRLLARPDVQEYPAAAALAADLGELPEAARRRFFAAPEAAHRIIHARSDAFEALLDFAQDALEAERLILDDNGFPSRAVWTALGDRLFQPAGERPVLGMAEGRAPVVGGSLAIDFSSPWNRSRPFGSLFDPELLIPIDAAFVATVTGKVARAVALIERIDPRVARFVLDNVRVVRIGRYGCVDDGRGELLGSGGTSDFIGQIELIVPNDAADVTLYMLANALVHEATHNFLFVFERRIFPVLSQEAAADIELASPWSGRLLPPYTMVHAAVVWYYLSRFWGAARATPGLDLAAVEAFLARSTKGYLGGTDVAALVGAAGDVVHEFFVALCANLQSEIRRDFA